MKRCITLLALAAAGIAFAQEPLPPFEEVDSNQDGQISRTEASAIEGLEFDTADTDQNGSVDRTEYMAAASSQGQGSSPAEPGQPGQPDAGSEAEPGAPGPDSGQGN